jgi:hypothetical protein
MLGIMGGDKKKLAQLIIGANKQGQSEMPKEVKEDNSVGIEAAMESLLKAIEAKDPKAMVSSFKNAFQLCESQPHEEYEGDEGEDE